MRLLAAVTCLAFALAGCATPRDQPVAAAWGLVPTRIGFPAKLAAAKANPGAVDWTALRAAYGASPAYDPSMGQGEAVRAGIAALNGSDWPTALTQADAALAANWMDLRAHYLAAVAKSHLVGANPQDADLLATEGMLRSIRATGDGHAPQTAFHVLAVSEEYVILELGNVTSQQQRLVQAGGHTYDMLAATDTKTGGQAWVYFNIDIPFAREKALATGQAQVVR